MQFWFELASTYSYPTAMRIDRLATAAGVTVEWKPFLLGPIFSSQGWNDSPFNIYPAKGRYMWRDLERICEREHLPLKLPPVAFPQHSLLATRIAVVGSARGFTAAFSRAVYSANFAEQRDISDPEVLAAILGTLGLDAEEVLAAAATPETKARLRHESLQATQKGIFGAPSMLVGEELFWGNDRLDDAIAWAAK